MHKLNFGSVVIHPGKSWPWIGTLEYNHQYHQYHSYGGSPPPKTCEKCKNPVKSDSLATASSNQPSTSDSSSTSKSTADIQTYCSCPPASTTTDAIVSPTETPAAIAASVHVSIAAGFAALGNLEAKIQSFENKLVDMGLVPDFWSGSQHPSMTYRTAQRTSKQWRVNWYPTGEYGELDDTEVAEIQLMFVSICLSTIFFSQIPLTSGNGVTSFPIGSSVRRRKALEGTTDTCGFVQSCNFTADVFLFPSYQWVVKDVPSDKLKPAKVVYKRQIDLFINFIVVRLAFSSCTRT